MSYDSDSFWRFQMPSVSVSVIVRALAISCISNLCIVRAEQPAAPSANAAIPADSMRDSEPSPKLTPEDVVRYQIHSLAATGDISQRIERCYRFASPENRKYTGPLARFTEMVKTQPYDALLTARHVLVGRATIENNQAHLLVSVVNQRSELFLFRWLLSKQSQPEFNNCWMTDAVIPVGTPIQRAIVEKPLPQSI